MKFLTRSINKLTKSKFSELSIVKNHSRQFLQDYKDFKFLSDDNIIETVNFLKGKNFTDCNIVSLKNRYPFIFENNIQKSKMEVSELYDILSTQYGLNDLQVKFLILTNPECFDFTKEYFENKNNFLSENFNFKKENICFIMKNCPKLFFLEKNDLILKKKILEMFFDDKNHFDELLKLHPYILIAEADRIKRNLYKISEEGFSPDDFFSILKTYPLFIYRKPENIIYICKFLKKYGISKNELITLCKKNPFIFSMDFPKVFIPKIKIFESKGIKKELLMNMFIKFPWLITKGRNSIITKLRYIEKTSSKNIINQNYFPKILLYSYKNFIKPRGELMYNKKEFHWYDCLKMDDEEFCNKFEYDIEELKKLKFSEFHEKEFDFIKIGYLKYISKEINDKFYDHPLL